MRTLVTIDCDVDPRRSDGAMVKLRQGGRLVFRVGPRIVTITGSASKAGLESMAKFALRRL